MPKEGTPVTLHPAMTLQQMAEWCARHRREIRIGAIAIGDRLLPIITAGPRLPPSLLDPDFVTGADPEWLAQDCFP